MIQYTEIEINKLRENPNNPRFIRDEKFEKLVQSIKEFPKMLVLRPIVVDANFVVLGGNMRLKACKEAGREKVPVIIADMSEAEQNEFIIKDNVGFGEWDWDILTNWDEDLLNEWGLDTPNNWMSDLKEEKEETIKCECCGR